METLSDKMSAFDPNKDLNGAKITADTIGRLHIPKPLLSELVSARINRQSDDFLKVLVKAAHRGDGQAVSLLALMAYNGFLNNEKDRIRLASSLAEMADWAGSAFGTFVLGAIKLESREYAKALEKFEIASDSEFSPATWFAGKMYELGIGSAADPHKAAQFFASGMRMGYIFSDQSYADLIRRGPFPFFDRLYVAIMAPLYSVRFFFRNRFRSRTSQSYLLPPYAAEAILTAIKN